MNKSYSYYILIFIIIPLFSKTQLNLLNQSEIKLVFKGKGEQQILHSSFQYSPSEVKINGNLKETCKKSCYLENENKNEVIINFQIQINTYANMFKDFNNLIEADLSNFDASKVTDMTMMFCCCNKLKKIDFGDIDTSLVKSVYALFDSCEELTFADLSNFKTPNLEDIGDIFSSCYKLIAVKMQNFNTLKTWNMRGLFYHCYELKYVDLSNFQTPCVTNVMVMFCECKSLIYADLSSFIIQTNIET